MEESNIFNEDKIREEIQELDIIYIPFFNQNDLFKRKIL